MKVEKQHYIKLPPVKTATPNISLIRLSELPKLTRIHSLALMRFRGEQVGVTLRTEYAVDPDFTNMLTLRLQARYTMLHHQIIRPLCEYAIEAVFETDEDAIDISDGEILLPQWLSRLTLSVGIGALRGMLAQATKNTFLTHYPLPLFDMTELVASIDPENDGGRGMMPELSVELPEMPAAGVS